MKQFNRGTQPRYKRGNLWIYVGLATISATWQLSQLNAQAATTDTGTAAPTADQVTTTASATGSQTVALSTSTTTTKPVTTTETSSSTQSTDNNGATTKNTPAPTGTTTTPKPATTANDQTQPSEATKPTVQPNKPVTPIKSDTSDTTAEPTATPVDTTKQVTNNSGAISDQSTDPQTVTTQVSGTPATTTKPRVQLMKMSAAVAAPDIATSVANDPTGIDWKITADGTLHLSAGTLADLSDNVDVSPWNAYRNQIKTVDFDGPVTASAGINGLFSSLTNVTTINNLTALDTTNATDMGSMFYNMPALTSLDLSNFKTSKVLWMNNMFQGDESLTALDVSGFDTRKVFDMNNMFQGLDGLTSLDLSSLSTASVGYDPGDTGTFTLNNFVAGGTNSKLTTLILPTFDLTYVPQMEHPFANLNKLTSLTLSSVNHGKQAIDFYGLVSMMSSLTTLDLSHFQINAGDNDSDLLTELPNLTTLTLGPDNTLDHSINLVGGSGRTFLDQWVANGTQRTYSTDDLVGLYGSDRSTAASETYTHKRFFIGKDTTQLAGPKATWNPLSNLTVLDMFLGAEDQTDQQIYTFDGTTLYNADGTVHTGDLNTGALSSMQHPITVTMTAADGSSVTPTELATQPGTYAIHFATVDNFDNPLTADGVVTVVATKAAVKAKATDQPVIVGPATSQPVWQSSDNFDSAMDENGQPLSLAKLTAVTITRDQTPVDTVDYTKAGLYKVTYQYTDPAGNERTDTATIDVEASKAAVAVKQNTVSFFAGNQHSTWPTAANLASVTDATGQSTTITAVTVTKDGQPTADNQVDPTQAGVYTVTYLYRDAVGNEKTAQTTVTVKQSQASLQAQPVTKYAGPQTSWQAEDNLQQATDENGQPLTATSPRMAVAVTAQSGADSSVKTDQPGTYLITYTYTDVDGNTVTTSSPLTFKASAAQLTPTTAQQTYYVMPKQSLNWDATTALTKALAATGQTIPITALRLSLDGQPVTGTALQLPVGQHQVTYAYTDPDGNVTTAVVPVTIKADLSNLALTTTTPTITAGQSWSPLSNIAQLMTTDGHQVSPTAVTVSYAEDGVPVTAAALTQPGVYTITYLYTDATGKQLSQQATLTVVAPTKASQPTTSTKTNQQTSVTNLAQVNGSEGTPDTIQDGQVATVGKTNAATKSLTTTAKAKAMTLPQTDETTSNVRNSGWGLVLLALLSPLMFWRKRRS